MNRVASIDVVRGLVMVIMALDHLRDLLHLPALTQDPLDLTTTTAPIFLTRWITHLCAPTFVFLSGTSAWLAGQKRNPNQRRAWLLQRGLVLIALEITLINFAFWTDVQFRTLMLQVIYAIGGGLVVLAFIGRWPIRVLAGLGLGIVFLHDLLLLLPPFQNLWARLGWALLFRMDVLQGLGGRVLLVGYPLVPWLGIMLLGFCCGPLFRLPPDAHRQRIGRLAVLFLLGFVGLRGLNLYGDAAPWAVQKTPLFTFLSFINVSKYPPSLLYTLLMLGLMFGLLWLADGRRNTLSNVLTTYGRVPMFYYLLHWYLVKTAMFIMVFAQGYTWHDVVIGPLSFGRPPGAGVSLPVVYGVWLALVALLYPLCRRYGTYKAAHPENRWLQYL